MVEYARLITGAGLHLHGSRSLVVSLAVEMGINRHRISKCQDHADEA